ncbi:hypothetical protein BpHYR1_047784 [Brachionus plicatilis]|uniref:Uncharacterized protein n=1 Tax=Brachionus plicatilis TaxID=10195 RepID=A0A3M7T899_BRAPC|nr:hypothetical protein BpHYR1_047784 [Brachionus plicatilis]
MKGVKVETLEKLYTSDQTFDPVHNRLVNTNMYSVIVECIKTHKVFKTPFSRRKKNEETENIGLNDKRAV